MNTEQERAAFEAWCLEKYNNPGMERTPDGYAHTATHQFMPMTYASVQMLWEAFQAGRAALQSQDREVIIEALETAQNNLGSCRPFGSSDPDSNDYDHDAFMWDYYQRAIDHARRIEGDGE